MLQNGREIAPSVSWDILLHIKRSGGMSVNELAAALKMSYMGVKQHCDDLKKRGYVDTWRRPKQTGRPEKMYRPTEKLDLVLPNWGGELCLGLLNLVAQAYGETVPERLLNSFLQQKVEQWNARLKGQTPKERATELAKLRTADGWLCQCVEDPVGGLRLVDHHSPLVEVARLFPAVWELEARVLSRVFGHVLTRRQNGTHAELVIIEGSGPPPETEAAPISLKRRGAARRNSQAPAAPAAPEPAADAIPAVEAEAETNVEDEPAGVDVEVVDSAPEPEAVVDVSADMDEAVADEKRDEAVEEAAQSATSQPEAVESPEEPESDDGSTLKMNPIVEKVRKPRGTKQPAKAVADSHQDLFNF